MQNWQQARPCSKFTAGLSDEKKKDIESKYRAARSVIERTLEVLQKELEDNLKSSDSVTRFDKPNWANQQAYDAGYRQALRDSQKLLTPKVDHDL